MRTCWAALLALALAGPAIAGSKPKVRLQRLPMDGVQPQVALDSQRNVHVVFLAGKSQSADVFYMRSEDDGRSFSKPQRVNSQPGSATAIGSIRGAQLAVGKGGRVHVAWNGSSSAEPRGPLNPEAPPDSPHNGLPMLYSRQGNDGKFEPQRTVMRLTFGLDGGGSVAADAVGNVYVAWHGKAPGAAEGEQGRRIWLAHSSDEGETFSRERAGFETQTGACGCCGMRLFADHPTGLLALYRSAAETVHRDVYLLSSDDQGRSFAGALVEPWEIGACPMSSMFFSQGKLGLFAAWETAEQVRFGRVDAATPTVIEPTSPPGDADRRKHPVLAQTDTHMLLAWVVARGWGKPPNLHWRLFSPEGKPLNQRGRVRKIPAWSFAAVFARADGGFTILY